MIQDAQRCRDNAAAATHSVRGLWRDGGLGNGCNLLDVVAVEVVERDG